MNAIRAALKWLQKNLSRRELICLCLIAGLCVGMLAHGFMFANKIPNHDDLEHYADLGVVGVANGRYVLHLIWKLFSDLSVPWLNGIMGTLFLCGAAFFVCESFDVTQRWQALTATCLLQLYPVNVSTYCYMYEAHVFMLGVMLAAASVWVVHKQKGWLRFAVCALLIMLSTGIYQIYVMFAIGLLMLLVIRRAAEGGHTAREDWGFAVCCAVSAIAGLVLYLIGLKLIQRFGSMALNSYQGIDQTGSLNLALIPQKIADSYEKVWEHFVSDVPDYITGRMRIFHTPLALLGAASLLLSAVGCIRRRAFAHAALVLVCALLLPLVCCGIYFMGDEIAIIHMITFYPMLLIHMLPLVLIRPEEKVRLSVRSLAALAAMVLYLGYSFQCVILDNQAYYRHYLSFTRAQHTAERMARRIEELPEYQPGTKVAVAGYMNAEQSLVYFEYDVASRFLPFVGMRMELDYFWDYCLPNLLSRVIGLPVTGAGDDWVPTDEQEAAIVAMPCYPEPGSIAFVDDVCVVKLSDEEFPLPENEKE